MDEGGKSWSGMETAVPETRKRAFKEEKDPSLVGHPQVVKNLAKKGPLRQHTR